MKNISPIQVAISLLAAFVCAFFSAGLTRAIVSKGFGSAEVAAWVQAIGSISALCVAVYVSARQNTHSARLITEADKTATLRRARSVVAVVICSYDQVKRLDAPLRQHFQLGIDLSAVKRERTTDLGLLNESIARVKAIPAHELGSFHMTNGLLQVSTALLAYRTLLEYLIQAPHQHGNRDVTMELDGYRKIFDEGMKKFDNGLNELGIDESTRAA